MTEDKENENLSNALRYQKAGFAILPLHTVRNGVCTCKKPDCSNPGKHPRTRHGVKDATKDPNKIREWFGKWPDSNIGIATGGESEIVVLDVDVKKGKPGLESLKELQDQIGPLPNTLTCQTPSGGLHYYFKTKNLPLKNKLGFMPGLDLMANGGYVVAPPSLTGNDLYYEWIKKCPIADIPNSLVDFVRGNKTEKTSKIGDIGTLIKRSFPNGEEKNGELITHCIFHDDKHPSLSINLTKGLYYCFACQGKGDVRSLLAKLKETGNQNPDSSSEGNKISFSNLVENDGRLCKIKALKDATILIPITSFLIEPLLAIVIPNQGEYLRVKLTALNGKSFEVCIPPWAWESTQKFIKVLPTKETTFTGNSTDVQSIRAHVAEKTVPTSHGTRVSGFHENIFVTEEGALAKEGPVTSLTHINEHPSNCHLLSQSPALEQELHTLKTYLPKFNSPQIVAIILGWTVACFFKTQITRSLGSFPILCLEGEPGSGKTTTITRILMPIWALKGEPNGINELKKFGFMKLVSGSNTIPVVFEENKGCRMSQDQRNLVSTVIRDSYNGLQGYRGRPDQSLITYSYQAPLAIAGESGFSEPAVLDRIVTAQFSIKESLLYKQDFEILTTLPLSRLGRTLLNKALHIQEGELSQILKEEISQVTSELKDRPRHNAAIVRTGLRILGQTLSLNFERSIVDKGIIEQIYLNGRERKSIVDLILEGMGLMSQFENITIEDGEYSREGRKYLFADHLEPFVHYRIDRCFIRLAIAEIYPIFQKWAFIHKFDRDNDVIAESAFKKQLKHESYFEDHKPMQIGSNKIRNVYILDLRKMKEKGLTIPWEWGEALY